MNGFPHSPFMDHVFKNQVSLVFIGIIGNRVDRHRINQCLVIDATLGNNLLFGLIIVNEIQIIQISEVLVNTIGHKDIFQPIIVHIKHQCRPTPICRLYIGQAAHVTESTISVVHMKHVSGVLVVIIMFHIELKFIPTFKSGNLFEPF